MSEIEPCEAPAAHFSSIVVWSRDQAFSDCLLQLADCAGVEVHYSHAESGRIVVVQETDSVEAQEAGYQQIQRLPAVRMAALVEHRIVS